MQPSAPAFVPGQTYRLVTRSDFDGLVCAVLLRRLGIIDDILFVHPKDVQDGVVDLTDRDITTNLPYDPRPYLVFDHHASETLRNTERAANHVIDPAAPSAARVVYDYLGGRATFPGVPDALMLAVDQADSAQYELDDILDPQGWTLLNFLMDSRTGLGRFRTFRISNYQLMMALCSYPTWPSGSSSIGSSPSCSPSSCVAAAMCTANWSPSTCAAKTSFTPETGS
jgi:hypothetical protein